MRRLRQVAFFGFVATHLAMLAGGLLYATTRRMLPYHEQALGQSWVELTPSFRSLYLMMCRAIGVPTAIAALALLALLIFAWRRGERWALWAVPLLTLGYGLPMLAITVWVRVETGAETPTLALAIGNALALLATALSFAAAGKRSQPMRTSVNAAQF
jgi:hypothetical protein